MKTSVTKNNNTKQRFVSKIHTHKYSGQTTTVEAFIIQIQRRYYFHSVINVLTLEIILRGTSKNYT